jgi:low affinity Fe/Cu permease
MATSRPSRSPASLLLSRADRYASRPAAAGFVVAAAGAWLAVSIVAGFPARWETVFETATSSLTLAMVFVIQHTQARHQRATQRKLDEILLAVPGTDNSLVTLEHASDDELHAVGHQHRSVRQAALEDADEETSPSDDAGWRPSHGLTRRNGR